MAEMTNADLFQLEFGIYATELWAMPEDNFLEWLNAPCDRERPKNMPSAQPEIIRCKDCMNWDTTWQSNGWAKNYHYCPMIDRTCNGDWYCSDAERRTDGSD